MSAPEFTRYEYKVVPAPRKGRKAKGLKTPGERFANALAATINLHAADGWDYVRTDTLPSEERKGLTGKTTVFQNMLIFRRQVSTAEASLRPVDPPATSPAPPLGPPVAVETEAAPPAARVLGPAETAPAPASNSSAPAVPSPLTVAERP